MCLVQKGKVLELKGKNAIVLVNGNEKEVRVEGEVKVGDQINIFQNLGFKK
jgi:hydrogenase maturation factor